MNRIKCIKILSGLLGVFLLLSFFPLVDSQPISANPDRLEWSVVDTPSEEGNVVVSPSEINAFVAGQNETFYAIDIPNEKIYKSVDAGITWENITDALLDANAELPAWDIAVAPDNPELVAVVTDDRTAVYVSDDGGKNWEDSGVPDLGGMLISDIAISPKYDDTYDVAIGTRYPDGLTNGDVWVITLRSPAPSWKAQELQIDPDATGTGADVSTVRFSPQYDADKAILAIASSANDIAPSLQDRTFLCAGERNTASKETAWTTFIEIIDPSESSLGDSPDEDEIIFSDLALPSGDYREDSNWIAYASYYSNSTTECDDVYRIEEDGKQVYRLDAKGGNEVGIASIDYQGGTLLAGEVLGKESSPNALIHICSNPTECFIKWEEPTKPPTGGASSENRANAQVVWLTSGVLYCVTSTNNVTTAAAWANMTLPAGPWQGQACDESALSKSEDDGDTWNQLSLIDTEMTFLCDYAFFANNTILYLASINDHTPRFDSIWRTEKTETEALTKTWQRVLCLDGEDNIILRPTPDWKEEEQIYFAVPETDNVKYSENKGQSWEKVWECPDVTDLAVVSDELLYILDDDVLNKRSWNETLWGGSWEWKYDIDTGLDSGFAVLAHGTKYVFVSENGDKDRIAYSSDGGEIFNVTESLPEPGEIQLAVDEEFNSNKFIYAASDDSLSDIYRWAIGASTSWKGLNTPSKGFCGLAQIDEVLYGAYAYSDGVARTLVPHQELIRETDWDTTDAGLDGVTFRSRSLKVISNEDVELWAIDKVNYDFPKEKGCLWVYTDAFVLETPWPNTPALDDSLPCDECTCRAEDFCFRWRMLPSTEKYELWIALDEDFTAIIHKEVDITPDAPCSPAWCPSSSSVQFICGETYFWKVRSCESTEGERIRSRWSPTMKFTVKECSTEEGAVYLAPILLVPDIGSKNVRRSPTFSWEGFPPTTEYEFILASDDALNLVIVNEKVSTSTYQYKGSLDWNTTYYWQVKAIEPTLSEPALGVFTVMPAPEPTAATPPTPSWIWAILGILAFLDVVVITFCLIKR
jgi:hypothetical protein